MKIMPIPNAGRDCMEETLAAVVYALFGNAGALAYSRAWQFGMSKVSDGLFGSRIQLDWGRFEDNVRDQLGLSIAFRRIPKAVEALEILIQEIECGRPALFVLDSHFCNWHIWSDPPLREHTLIVTAVSSKEELVCVDCQPVTEDIPFSIHDFMQAYYGMIVTFSACGPLPEIDIRQQIAQSLLELGQGGDYGNAFEAMQEFADTVRYIDIVKECPNTGEQDIWNSYLFRGIKALTVSRYQFSALLMYLNEKACDPQIAEAAVRIRNAAKYWDDLRILFMKLRLTQRNTLLKKVEDRIRACIDWEWEAADLLDKLK